MGQTYLDADGNPLKATGAYLDEAGKVVGPKPPELKTPPNVNAKGGDTINGRDPNAKPGFLEGLANRFVRGSLEGMAQPRNALDLMAIGGLSSAPVAAKLLPGVAPLIEKLGRGMERTGQATKRAAPALAIGNVIGQHGGLPAMAESAAIEAAPYALEAAGRGTQAVGRVLQRAEPMVKFGGPVERTLAETTPAAAAPAAVATPAATAARTLSAEERQAVDALVQQGYTESDVLAELEKVHQSSSKFTPAAIKAKMNAAETKEYLRLLKTGKTPDEAAAMIKAQRAMTERLGIPSSETVRTKVHDRNASGRWED